MTYKNVGHSDPELVEGKEPPHFAFSVAVAKPVRNLVLSFPVYQ
jgi:hypothetical protein